jgi:hypothetical protein
MPEGIDYHQTKVIWLSRLEISVCKTNGKFYCGIVGNAATIYLIRTLTADHPD